jgi:hypothetical protein
MVGASAQRALIQFSFRLVLIGYGAFEGSHI